MAQATTQAERLRAEALHRPKPDPGIVTLRYRLQPADLLPEGKRSVVVRTVSAQGIEAAAPVVHFEGVAKPLLMDAANAAVLAQLAGTPLYSEWVGVKVTLYVVTEADADCIRLRPGRRRRVRRREPVPARTLVMRSAIVLLWLLILLILAYGAFALAAVWPTFEQILPLFPRP